MRPDQVSAGRWTLLGSGVTTWHGLTHVLAVIQRVLGDDHPETLRARHGRAAILAQQGLREQAEAEYRAVLAARERVIGTNHPDVDATRTAIEQLRRTAPSA